MRVSKSGFQSHHSSHENIKFSSVQQGEGSDNINFPPRGGRLRVTPLHGWRRTNNNSNSRQVKGIAMTKQVCWDFCSDKSLTFGCRLSGLACRWHLQMSYFEGLSVQNSRYSLKRLH